MSKHTAAGMVEALITVIGLMLDQTLPRTGDQFDDLCVAKLALADQMAKEIKSTGKESKTCLNLWLIASRFQEAMWKK